MTDREQFESVYRDCFPVSSSLQPNLFALSQGEYVEAKVHVAFTIWQASRATSNALPMEVYETLDMFMSLYRAKGWEGDAAYERAELLIAASAPKGDGVPLYAAPVVYVSPIYQILDPTEGTWTDCDKKAHDSTDGAFARIVYTAPQSPQKQD